MKRLIDWHLKEWKMKKMRKPLLLRGARQIGKTFAVRRLGKSFKSFVEVNFEMTKDVHSIFEGDLDPKRILQLLSAQTKQDITPGKTLLFLDEIQQVPRAIIALRYFYEMMPELHVIAAGSLLDFAIQQVGVPVGRISNLYMYPLSFLEYLSATDNSRLIEAILNHSDDKEIPDLIHKMLLDLLGEYLAIGGMPESVYKWIQTKNAKESFEVQHHIIDNYRMDFGKYAKKHQVKYLEQLYNQIPHLIGEQFKYKNIHGEYRKRELAPCLDMMDMAGIIHRVYHTSAQGIPLGAETNLEWFKIIYLDVALCQAILGLDLSTWFLKPNAEFINRGMIAEAFIGQELLCYSPSYKQSRLHFWRRTERNSSAEIDYIHEYQRQIIPIEVKSGHGGKLKSMHLFLDLHPQISQGFRFSSQNFSKQDKIVSKPLYAAVALAHPDQQEAIQSLL